MTEKKRLTVDQAAEKLGHAPKTILRMIHDGRLKGQKTEVDGHDHWLIDPEEVERLIDQDTTRSETTSDQDTTGTTPAADLLVEKDRLIQVLQAEVETLKAVIASKDQEVADLNERLREAHVLAQERRLLQEPGKRPWWAFWRR